MGWQGLSAAPGDLGVKPLADKRFLGLLSVFLASSFRLYARWAKVVLTMVGWSGGTGRCAEAHLAARLRAIVALKRKDRASILSGIVCAMTVLALPTELFADDREDLQAIDQIIEELLTSLNCGTVMAASNADGISDESTSAEIRLDIIDSLALAYIGGYEAGQRSAGKNGNAPEDVFSKRCEENPEQSFSLGSAINE
jgi:hypothetical protein